MKVSDCCGCPAYSNGDGSTEDYGLCPDCGEHCTYIEYCDECGEEMKDCMCDEDISDEKLTHGLDNDPEIVKILQEISRNKNPAVTGLNDITTNKTQK